MPLTRAASAFSAAEPIQRRRSREDGLGGWTFPDSGAGDARAFPPRVHVFLDEPFSPAEKYRWGRTHALFPVNGYQLRQFVSDFSFPPARVERS